MICFVIMDKYIAIATIVRISPKRDFLDWWQIVGWFPTKVLEAPHAQWRFDLTSGKKIVK